MLHGMSPATLVIKKPYSAFGIFIRFDGRQCRLSGVIRW